MKKFFIPSNILNADPAGSVSLKGQSNSIFKTDNCNILSGSLPLANSGYKTNNLKVKNFRKPSGQTPAKPKPQKPKKETIEFPKTLNTYVGPKGYTVLKSELTDAQIGQIKELLTVKPFTPGISLVGTVVFPAYRESTQKIYMPRFFGVQHFGPAKQVKIPEGDNIDVPFSGTLRDYQIEVVDAYKKVVGTSVGVVGAQGGLVNLPCGYGKTTVALNIVSVMRKKTLIIVHKEFLLNQWVERINQYLPTARIGRIQGQIVDIENKDIVIGMLQSLSMKDYEDSVFASFGMVLIDEVHHIGSEVFSCALFKIVPKYTLGLSATMDRKDGTTFVFKMFLGDIVYKIAEKKQRNVLVRAIHYHCADPVFNRVEYDFRGNPAYSTMISKLCEYVPRTEFIIRVVKDMFAENPDQQIMIIAHNKNVLTYIHDAIKEREIASVGYYIGGMKESALKTTELKQVVIATYAMAAEALDIKTLCTLVMVTPKTDIEQSVGRILRSDHDQPVVVDIVDSHDPFVKQWAKRKTFYKRENYQIDKGLSSTYKGLETEWETVMVPKAPKTGTKAAKTEDDKDDNDEDEDKSTKPVRQTIGKCVINLEDFE
jgi:superfamily II DNA or RNA helicase